MGLEIWEEVLGELKLELTQSAYNTWLANSRLLSYDDDVLVVAVCNEYAAEWLDSRLRGTVERIVARRIGEVQLSFVVNGDGDGDADAETVLENAPPDPPTPPVAVFAPPTFDTHEAGWFPVSEYECRFWAPYLGRVAWRVWEIVRKADRRREKTAWTPARRWTAPSLAAQVPCGRQAITGVNRKCDPDHSDAVLQDDGVYRRYQPGAFDRLQEAEIAEVERRGQGPHTTYRVRVRTKLPLLKPQQVQGLKARLQVEHDRWLADHGFDPADWDV
jgi:hypothetical protein